MKRKPDQGNLEDQILRRTVSRLRAVVMAVAFGATGATGLFIATVWLLLRGGENVGQHLNLLGNFLPGYSVTWGGAVLGLFYGAIVGASIGSTRFSQWLRQTLWSSETLATTLSFSFASRQQTKRVHRPRLESLRIS